MKKISCLFLLLILIFSACGGDSQSESQSSEIISDKAQQGQASVVDDVSQKNILQIAGGSKDHTTLVAAVHAAGIEDVLSNNGPITIFAPNNAAFEALPKGTVETLLKPENKAKLANILKNHAAPGTYKGKLLKNGRKIYMASGNYIEIRVDGKDVYIGDAKIIGTIEASNGVIQVIDKVLVPADK